MTRPESSGAPDRFAAVLRAVPALIVVLSGLVGALLVDGWRSRLPEPVASHWGSGGEADGFTSVGGVLISVVAAAAIGAAVCLVAFVRRVDASTRRMVTGISCGTAVFIIALIVGLTGSQVDRVDAAGAPLSGWAILVAVVCGVVAGVVAGYLLPGDEAGDAPPIVGEVPVAAHNDDDGEGDGDGVLWSGRATLAPVAMIVLGSSVLALLVTAALVGLWWILVPVAAILAVVTAATGQVRVTVSAQQVAMSGTFGRPRVVIPVGEIERAEVVPVSAVKDFGGWGIRIGFSAKLKGATGFVLRSGTGLMVVRTGDSPTPFRRDVVVVDGAESAAGTINAVLAAR